jgi:hypothetical protein
MPVVWPELLPFIYKSVWLETAGMYIHVVYNCSMALSLVTLIPNSDKQPASVLQ